MTHWIIPSNNKFFRLDDLLKERAQITWRQKNNFEAGDTIYIYSSSPQSRISYQLEVLRTGIPSSLCDTNETFWVNKSEYKKSLNTPRAELRLVHKFPPLNSLSLSKLREAGLLSNLQGGMKVSGMLLDYIQSSIKEIVGIENVSVNDLPEVIEETNQFYEGSLLQVNVNRYERNIKAREECIKQKGYSCCVCGMNFERIYGVVGRGFIHVHHIIPISEIGESYVVDNINNKFLGIVEIF